MTKIASEPHYGPWGLWRLQPAWSPDSKWIAYNLGNKAAYRTVSRLQPRAEQIDRGHRRPERLRRSGLRRERQVPLSARLDRRRAGESVVRAVERRHEGQARRLSRRAEEGRTQPAREGERRGEGRSKDAKEPKGEPKKDMKDEPKKEVEVVIDFDGIDQRVVPLPIPAADLSHLQAGAAGQIYYLQAPATRGDGPTGSTLYRFDLAKRKTEAVDDGRRRLHHRGRAEEGARSRHSARRAPGPRGQPTLAWSIIDIGGAVVPPGPGAAAGGARRPQSRCRRGAHRPARGVEADLRRSLAHQPRLLLRPEDARRRLEGHEEEVRGVPAASDDAAATSTASSAGCSANWPSGTAIPVPASGCTTRTPFAAACSARTTKSPTAAIASRRSTAA